mgnify:CR=1 FL=1
MKMINKLRLLWGFLCIFIESTMQRSCQLESGWNADNMRVIVSMLTTLDGGKTYTCNNVNECKLGESADYLYNE